MTRLNIYSDCGNITQDGEELKVHEKGHMIITPRYWQLLNNQELMLVLFFSSFWMEGGGGWTWNLTQVKGNRLISYVIPLKLVYSTKVPTEVAHFIWNAMVFFLLVTHASGWS
jgi:hypothetical protein